MRTITIISVCATISAATLTFADTPTGRQNYENILLPIYIHPLIGSVPGAYGSQWATDLMIRNEGDEAAVIFQNRCAYECIDSGGIPCVPGQPTQGHSAYTDGIHGAEFAGNLAVILHVEKGKAADVPMELRLYEISEGVGESGVEVPIVRDGDLFDRTLWLLNIPNRQDTRTHLRIYYVYSDTGDGDVKVRIYPDDDTEPVFDEVVSRFGNPTVPLVPLPDDLCVFGPEYQILDLTGIAPNADSVRVQIDPLSSGLRFWALVSVTNNETQHVTLVSPN